MHGLASAGRDLPCDRPVGLLSVCKARAVAAGLVEPIAETEEVELGHAFGRVLARSLVATMPVPRFDHSAMDGYAVAVAGLRCGSVLDVTGQAAAGVADDRLAVGEGCAVRIFTGAVLPSGTEAVIAQEEVVREAARIKLLRVPHPGDHIRRRGDETRSGDALLAAGTLISPLQMGVAASMGLARLTVVRKLRVAVFTTGSELRLPGATLAEGEIYDSNRFALRGLLCRPWLELIDLGSCPDRPRELAARLQAGLARADLVISAGGISVGDEDHMCGTFRRTGGDIVIKGVAIKPGKPLLIGRIGGVPYVGLPGNPAAAFVTFRAIVDALVHARAGLPARHIGEGQPATADFTWSGKAGRTVYLPACAERYDGAFPRLRLVPGMSAGMLHLLSRADGFAVIPPDCDCVQPGDAVGWLPFN